MGIRPLLAAVMPFPPNCTAEEDWTNERAVQQCRSAAAASQRIARIRERSCAQNGGDDDDDDEPAPERGKARSGQVRRNPHFRFCPCRAGPVHHHATEPPSFLPSASPALLSNSLLLMTLGTTAADFSSGDYHHHRLRDCGPARHDTCSDFSFEPAWAIFCSVWLLNVEKSVVG